MAHSFKQILARNFINSRGWRTKRKLLLIESDDWGAIRMPNKTVFKDLIKTGIIDGSSPFAKYDGIASEDDLTNLFESLSRVRDKNGSFPVITANCVVANPDFEKIKASGFNQYYYEPITETFKRYPKHSNCFFLWEQGISNNIFIPQLHGREHLNYRRWLKLLQENNKEAHEAFAKGTFVMNNSEYYNKKKFNIAAGLDYDNTKELNEIEQSLRDGVELFEELFKFPTLSFTAPNYTWDSSLEPTLFKLGIRFIQTSRTQKIPVSESETYRKRYHYLGEVSKSKLTYLVRNCYFEPALSNSQDVIDSCLKSVSNSFFWNKPAIISSHRLNYVGFLNQNNATKNLKMLEQLLLKIKKYWPDVEFISTPKLGEIINCE